MPTPLTAVANDCKVDLTRVSTDGSTFFPTKEAADAALAESAAKLAKLQYQLYATGKHALLVVLQGMDGAGKDSLVQHVMAGLNPQGVEVTSFKTPTPEERAHDFLWRCHARTPRRGIIGIFNRSHYEDVLIARVHPELVVQGGLPNFAAPDDVNHAFWDDRLTQIRHFEALLVAEGTSVVKIFLHLSKAEQKERFLERLDEPRKHWKFRPEDVKERAHWDAYQKTYEQAISATSTKHAPWYIVPADKKWAARSLVADLLVEKLGELDLKVPKESKEVVAARAATRLALAAE